MNGTSAAASIWVTSVGKKVVMAVSGFVLVGYVILHMLGNLKIYAGEAAFNAYAAWLREVGSPAVGHEQVLWLVRLVLLAALVLHVWMAVDLTRMSQAARPERYRRKRALAATPASRTMRWGGLVLALFVVYHVLHLTVGAVGYGPGQFQPLSVYRNVVLGFSVWYVAASYVVAMVALGFHLYHGVWSMFQTLGVPGAATGGVYRGLAAVVAWAVALGNISIPLAVLAGVVR
jgi:succinate dehydrogenase / fumarate reductase cytochrome b subunit